MIFYRYRYCKEEKQVWCYRFTLNSVSCFETLKNCNSEKETKAYELIAKNLVVNVWFRHSKTEHFKENVSYLSLPAVFD